MDRVSSTSKSAIYTHALFISFTLCWPFALTLSCACVSLCVCAECDCWPSVALVKLLVRVAILLCELKCFATHSNKNICTHAHTHSYKHTHTPSANKESSKLNRLRAATFWRATFVTSYSCVTHTQRGLAGIARRRAEGLCVSCGWGCESESEWEAGSSFWTYIIFT